MNICDIMAYIVFNRGVSFDKDHYLYCSLSPISLRE